MEGRSHTSAPVIWVFRLSGGEPFVGLVSIPGTMPVQISHTGKATVHTLGLSEAEAATLGQFLQTKGIQVYWEAQEVNPEQQEEISRLHDSEVVFLTPKCPTCFWLDILSPKSSCGVEGWTQEMVDDSLDDHEKAVTDLMECPLRARPNHP